MYSDSDLAQQSRRALAAIAARPLATTDVGRLRSRGIIGFSRPVDTLPVSVTGPSCELNCAHCNAHYLAHMRPIDKVSDPKALSLLVSGGCDRQGRVPLADHLSSLATLSRGRRINCHAGFVDEDTARSIAPYVDLISFDVVGDRETAREVYGLDVGLADYMAQYDMLSRHVRTVPHVTLGLRGGRFSGERAALDALSQRDPDTVVLIILIPTPGTRYAACDPPPLDDVAAFFLEARDALPSSGLYLGCMRPAGRYRALVDELAVRAGLDLVVNPARSAIALARDAGLETSWRQECCALD